MDNEMTFEETIKEAQESLQEELDLRKARGDMRSPFQIAQDVLADNPTTEQMLLCRLIIKAASEDEIDVSNIRDMTDELLRLL